MSRYQKKRTIRTFGDLEFESKMLPVLGDEIEIVPQNELEGYFINTAIKHGVVDQMFDHEIDCDEPW